MPYQIELKLSIKPDHMPGHEFTGIVSHEIAIHVSEAGVRSLIGDMSDALRDHLRKTLSASLEGKHKKYQSIPIDDIDRFVKPIISGTKHT